MGGPNELQWKLSRPPAEAPRWDSDLLGFQFAPPRYSIPIWFPAVLSGVLAAIPWVRSVPWSLRFSLSTLLIATAVIAVILGIVAATN
jgi:hypothetical protein